jgi:hypothetical protein
MTVERVLVKDYWVQRGDLKIILLKGETEIFSAQI